MKPVSAKKTALAAIPIFLLLGFVFGAGNALAVVENGTGLPGNKDYHPATRIVGEDAAFSDFANFDAKPNYPAGTPQNPGFGTKPESYTLSGPRGVGGTPSSQQMSSQSMEDWVKQEYDPRDSGSVINMMRSDGFSFTGSQMKKYRDYLNANPQDGQNGADSQKLNQMVNPPTTAGGALTLVDKIGNLLLMVYGFMVTIALWVLGILMMLAAQLIDIVSCMDVIAGAAIVQEGWTFVRDALNFVYILLLLWIAFSTITDMGGFGIKQMLPKVIISALLVNFSLVFCGLILQVANISRDAILGKESVCKQSQGAGTSLTAKLANAAKVGGAIFKYDSSAGFFGSGTWVREDDGWTGVDVFGKSLNENMLNVAKSFIFAFFIGMFTVAMIILAGALIIRTATLAFLTMLSPAPYALRLIPKTAPYAAQWWDAFLTNAFFMPIIFFFLVLIAKVYKGGGSAKDSVMAQFIDDNNIGAVTGMISKITLGSKDLAGLAMALFDMVFISIMMFVAIMLAKKLAGRAAGAIENVANKATGFAKMPITWANRGAVAAVKSVPKGAWNATKYATREYGPTLAAKAGEKVGLKGDVLSRARTAGRAIGRVLTNTRPGEQVSEAQKAVKGRSDAELRTAMAQGNVGAAAELMDRGELTTEEDFKMAESLMPKGTGALAQKFQREKSRKLAVTAATGIGSSALKSEFASTSTISGSTYDAMNKKKSDIRKNFSKMDKKEYKDAETQIRAMIRHATQQVKMGEKNMDNLIMDINPGNIRDMHNSLSAEGKKDLQTLAKDLRTRGLYASKTASTPKIT